MANVDDEEEENDGAEIRKSLHVSWFCAQYTQKICLNIIFFSFIFQRSIIVIIMNAFVFFYIHVDVISDFY